MSETRYLNEKGEVVSLRKSSVGTWVVMAEKDGETRLYRSRFLPPRRYRGVAQTNLDCYAAVHSWQAVEEAQAAA